MFLYFFEISLLSFFWDYLKYFQTTEYPLIVLMLKKIKDCNQFHNILRPFDVLPNFIFTTSETMGDDDL